MSVEPRATFFNDEQLKDACAGPACDGRNIWRENPDLEGLRDLAKRVLVERAMNEGLDKLYDEGSGELARQLLVEARVELEAQQRLMINNDSAQETPTNNETGSSFFNTYTVLPITTALIVLPFIFSPPLRNAILSYFQSEWANLQTKFPWLNRGQSISGSNSDPKRPSLATTDSTAPSNPWKERLGGLWSSIGTVGHSAFSRLGSTISNYRNRMPNMPNIPGRERVSRVLREADCRGCRGRTTHAWSRFRSGPLSSFGVAVGNLFTNLGYRLNGGQPPIVLTKCGSCGSVVGEDGEHLDKDKHLNHQNDEQHSKMEDLDDDDDPKASIDDATKSTHGSQIPSHTLDARPPDNTTTPEKELPNPEEHTISDVSTSPTTTSRGWGCSVL